MEEKPIYLICTHYFPTPTSWRGPFCYDFAMAVMRSGKYDVRVFVPGHGGDYDYHGIHVYRYESIQFPLGLMPFVTERWNRRSFARKVVQSGVDWKQIAVFHSHEIDLLELAKEVKRHNPQVKHVHHFHAAGHPFHVRVPRLGVIPFYSDLVYRYYRDRLNAIDVPTFVSRRQQSLMGKWYPDGFLGEAKDVRDDLTFGSKLAPVRLRNEQVLYNGIDYSVFNDTGRVGTEGSNGFVIGCVGNFAPVKDQITLIRAAEIVREKVPGLKVRLVGSGSTLAMCQAYVAQHGLTDTIEFVREMDHLKLPDFYRSLDLFVLPSWAEGFACSYMEAYGCGTPFMGCREVSVDEALLREDWDKWLFKRQDYETLSKLILDYVRNRTPQRLSRDFNIDGLVGEYLDAL